jgi:hypothetical protein
MKFVVEGKKKGKSWAEEEDTHTNGSGDPDMKKSV